MEIQKLVLKFIRHPRWPNFFFEKEQSWRTHASQNLQGTVFKTVWYGHKDRYINRWDWVESSETEHPYGCGQLIWQGCQVLSMGKNSFFSKWCWDSWISMLKYWYWKRKLILDLQLTLHTTIDSKQVNDLNMTAKPIKLLEDSKRVSLQGSGFLDMITEAWAANR